MEWGLGTFFPLKMAIYKYQPEEIRKLLRKLLRSRFQGNWTWRVGTFLVFLLIRMER